MSARNDEILALVKSGLSHAAVARRTGLTRERIGQIAGRVGRTRNVPARLQLVYRAIVAYMDAHHGLPPTIRELMDATGITSTSLMNGYLRKLAEQEKIAFVDGSNARNYYLPGATWTPPH